MVRQVRVVSRRRKHAQARVELDLLLRVEAVERVHAVARHRQRHHGVAAPPVNSKYGRDLRCERGRRAVASRRAVSSKAPGRW